jgi:hypothetical protein
MRLSLILEMLLRKARRRALSAAAAIPRMPISPA